MKRKVDQYQRASIAWPILVDCAGNSRSITYGDLGKKMGGVHPRVCRFFLGIIQEYCLENKLPPLQSLAVNKSTGVPGKGYIASPRDRIISAHEEVFKYNWGGMPNPF